MLNDLDAASGSGTRISSIIEALDRVRVLLDMDVSYVSEARPDGVKFQYVSGDADSTAIEVDKLVPYDDLYCASIVKGELPNLVRDTDQNPIARNLKFVQEARVRSFISVPIQRSNGDLYGMFCCFSRSPNESLNERDVDIVRMFADLAARPLNARLDEEADRNELIGQVSNVIEANKISTYFQPIVALSDQRPMALEALSRFHATGRPDPQWWFRQAGRADLESELELAAMRQALRYLPRLPESIYVTINLSPKTMVSRALEQMVAGLPPKRVILELTEHHRIADVQQLVEVLAGLRMRDIGIAIDDLGAGYAGLSTVLRLNAHVIKLDRDLVSRIHTDKAKQSLTKAMVHFAQETGTYLIAEGVELPEEHDMLRSLGVRLGQGYLYAQPEPAEAIIPRIWDSMTTRRQARTA